MVNLSDPNALLRFGQSILGSLEHSLSCADIPLPERRFVGFARPPQDCCPDLVVWLGNIRTWDMDFPDSRRSGRLLCVNDYAIDITVRIGRCFIDVDPATGSPLDVHTLEQMSAEMYADGLALYVGWVNQWRAGNISELSTCDLVNAGPLTQYNDGGCAGHEFTITVSLL